MIRVLLIEDHGALRDALAAVLDLDERFEVVGAVGRGDEAGSAARAAQPDVALVDLDLPGGDGVSAVEAVRAVHPPTAFVVLTASTDPVELGRAVEAGVGAVLHKSADVTDVIAALDGVARGANLVPAADAAGWLRALGAARENGWYARVVGDTLTGREREVLDLLARGATNDTIARALHISPQTVQTHVRNLLAKFGVGSRLEAVTEAIRLGLVDVHMDVRTPPRLPRHG